MADANIDDALALVAEHFRGATDKDGEPYVMHCLRVMLGTSSTDAQLVGLMHDLVEDTPITLQDLRSLGFSRQVVEAIDLVTHREQESYATYVIKLKPNELARDAKISDLRDNTCLSRVLFREPSMNTDSQRIRRYILSYQFLSDRISQDSYLRLMASNEPSL